MNLHPSLSKLIQKYQEAFGALPPPLSCTKLVQMDPKISPRSLKSLWLYSIRTPTNKT